MSNTIRATLLYCQSGSSDKEYRLEIRDASGWDGKFACVWYAYGRRGSKPQEGYKTADGKSATSPALMTYYQAERLFQSILDEKLRKGYRTRGTGVQQFTPEPDNVPVYRPPEPKPIMGGLKSRLEQIAALREIGHPFLVAKALVEGGHYQAAMAKHQLETGAPPKNAYDRTKQYLLKTDRISALKVQLGPIPTPQTTKGPVRSQAPDPYMAPKRAIFLDE